MKKMIMTALFALMTVTTVFSMPVCERETVNIELSSISDNNIKNCISKQKPIADYTCVYLTMFLENDIVFTFNVTQRADIDGKVYLIGNGSNGSTVMCIDGDKVILPVNNHRCLEISGKKISNYILGIASDVPVTNNIR